MISKILLILICFWPKLHCEYSKLQVYGDTMCNLLIDFVKNNDGQTSSDVLNYVKSSATQTVFNDGKKSGYDRTQILFESYQTSFTINPQVEIIIDGLHDALEEEKKNGTIIWYVNLAGTGLSSCLMMYLVGFSYVYFKKDRPAVNYYKANAHRYYTNNPQLTVNNPGINTNPIDTNTPLLVPEPFFPSGQ
jgi:hypothetical protein